jgi:hypothetical protein
MEHPSAADIIERFADLLGGFESAEFIHAKERSFEASPVINPVWIFVG